jgi:hypothetical protein
MHPNPGLMQALLLVPQPPPSLLLLLLGLVWVRARGAAQSLSGNGSCSS